MKLRNKKTGEIGEVGYLGDSDGKILVNNINDLDTIYEYDSLAEFNAEWEDYEELKEYWYIHVDGGIYKDIQDDVRKDNGCKEIGNYFETREEAEKAVEKLKAWKRLKDYNVKFNLDFVKNKIDFTYSINNPLLDVLDGQEQIFNNMKIVFGGEE